MINRLGYLLATLPLMVTLAACTTTTSPTKTSLWEVSSAQRTVYIASDTLVLSAEDYPLPVPFTKAFAASNELYVEQVPRASKESRAKIHSLIMTLGALPEDKTIEDVLTPTQLAAVKAAVKKRGKSFSHLERLRPWLLALVLSEGSSSHSKHATKPPPQLTTYFYAKAEAQNIPVTPFESIAKMLDAGTSLPMKVQVNFLMQVIQPHSGNKKQHQFRVRKLVKAWRDGNTAAVLALSGNFNDMPKVRQALVVHRNQTWAHVLESKLHTQGKPIFVVVGDGHLMGQDSMLPLLRKDGFQVRQL